MEKRLRTAAVVSHTELDKVWTRYKTRTACHRESAALAQALEEDHKGGVCLTRRPAAGRIIRTGAGT